MLNYNVFLHNICKLCHFKPVFDIFVPKLVATGLDQLKPVFTGSGPVFLGSEDF